MLFRSTPLRFAVIGCGSVARAQHIPNIVKSPRMILHTCVDLDDAVLAECRDVFGARHIRKDYQGAIEDPEVDVICLATTEKLRLPVIALAAKAGKPVYVEKPLAMTLEEMSEIMRSRRIRHIPICDEEGKLMGVISIGDINAHHAMQQSTQIHYLNEYIYGRV